MASGHTPNTVYKNQTQVQAEEGTDWYHHYYLYLTSLAYQLFKWENLPDSIDPRYLEMCIHSFGFVGFINDKTKGFLASQGTVHGQIDHYWLPNSFQAVSPVYNRSFQVFNYFDDIELIDKSKDEHKEFAVVVWNNDHHIGTIPSLKMFARELAETQEVISVNRNAQKTPVLLTANDKNIFSIKNIYKQYEGNAPVIITHEDVDPETIKVHKTDAPYVVDKLRSDRDKIWNEVMTFMGIKNANLEKKERMVTSEVDSNDQQIQSSSNVFLKAREEACERINLLFKDELEKPVKVSLREEIVEQFQDNLSTDVSKGNEEGGSNG